jgi:hypothetical protein
MLHKQKREYELQIKHQIDVLYNELSHQKYPSTYSAYKLKT